VRCCSASSVRGLIQAEHGGVGPRRVRAAPLRADRGDSPLGGFSARPAW
jgi:hypothetical protein